MDHLILFIQCGNMKRLLLLLFLFFCLLILFTPFYLFETKKAFIFSVVFFIIYIIAVEVLFRICYKIKIKKTYQFIPRLPFKKMYFEPHPYLPFVYKKNFICQKAMPAIYPLHRDKGYMFAELKINNFRHINGPKGDRDIVVPKPKNLIRINCLGGSTTGNSIYYNHQNYSYPVELEKILQATFPKLNLEVNNCGMGAYTTAEILIKFLLDTIDTEPDIVVIYHAYNDLQASLTTGFQSDYSHSRMNLGETYHLFKLASMIPDIPLAFWNYVVNNLIFQQNIRFGLLGAITKKDADIRNDFQGLNTYARNIEHLINICKANKIKVILSTFCYYLYPEINNDLVYLKYCEGVKLENEVIRRLSSKHNLPLVENDLLIPEGNEYFVDTVHFTPEGMQLLAKNISCPIIDYLKTLDQKG